jgi:hypothetical protein
MVLYTCFSTDISPFLLDPYSCNMALEQMGSLLYEYLSNDIICSRLQFVRVCKHLDQLIPWNLLPILQEMLDSPVFIVINMDSLQ